MAQTYIWWKSPDEVLADPDRLVAQVMEIGDYDDVQTVAAAVGDHVLRGVLLEAGPGIFSPRSWAYWHYRLNLASPGQVPPQPRRRLPAAPQLSLSIL